MGQRHRRPGWVVALSVAFIACTTAQSTFSASSLAELRTAAASVNGLAPGTSAIVVLAAGTYAVSAPGLVFSASGVSVSVRGTGAVLDCGGARITPLAFTAAGSHAVSGVEFRNCKETALSFDLGVSGAAQPTARSSVSVTNARFSSISAPLGALAVRGALATVTVSGSSFTGCGAPSDPSRFNVSVTPVATWAAHALYAELYGGGNSLSLSSTTFTSNGQGEGKVTDSVTVVSGVHCLAAAAQGTYSNATAAGAAPGCSVSLDGVTYEGNYATLSAGLVVHADGGVDQRTNVTVVGSTFIRGDMASDNAGSRVPVFDASFEPAMLWMRSDNANESSFQALAVSGSRFESLNGGSGVLTMSAGRLGSDVEVVDSTFRNITTYATVMGGVGVRGGRNVQLHGITADTIHAVPLPGFVEQGFDGNAGPAFGVYNMIGLFPNVSGSVVNVTRSSFSNIFIKTESSGSAVYNMNVENSYISSSTFSHNIGNQGADLQFAQTPWVTNPCNVYIDGVTAEYATGRTRDGGSLFAQTMSGVTKVANSVFRHNRLNTTRLSRGESVVALAQLGGAAVFRFLKSVEIYNCTFQNNTAVLGGAVAYYAVVQALVHGSTFTGNKAITELGQGGAIGISQSGGKTNLNMVFNTFVGNTASRLGGAVFAPSNRVALAYCNFTRNAAPIGGAIEVNSGATLEIDQPWWFPYSNYGDFGTWWPDAFNMYKPVPKYASVFDSNMAYTGGAIQVEDSNVVTNNYVWGMAFAWEPENNILLNTTFVNNRALSGGALSLVRPVTGVRASYMYFANNTALRAEDLLSNPFGELEQGQSPEGLALANGCGLGNGGALCLTCTGQCGFFDPLAIANSQFIGNKAHYGGGAYLSAVPSLCANPDKCYKFYITGIQQLYNEGFVTNENPEGPYQPGSQCNFVDNEARGGAGGAVYMENLGIARFICDDYDQSVNATMLPLDPAVYEPTSGQYVPCASWKGNKATEGGLGDVIATTPLFFQMNVENPGLMKDYPSGEDLPIGIEVMDLLGADITAIALDNTNNATLVQVLVDDEQTLGKNAAIVGGQLTQAVPRNFSDFQVLGVPGPRTINFQGLGTNIRRNMGINQVNITVRKCRLNEYSTAGGRLCPWCPAGFYNTDITSSICTPCPDSATCVMDDSSKLSPNPVIVPDDEFWNSNPFSEQVYECFSPHACTYDGRKDRIIAYQNTLLEDPTKFNFGDYNSIMCAEGHTGPLCGTCARGYGFKKIGICAPCPDNKPLNTFLYILVSCITLVPLAFTARSAIANAVFYIYGRMDGNGRSERNDPNGPAADTGKPVAEGARVDLELAVKAGPIGEGAEGGYPAPPSRLGKPPQGEAGLDTEGTEKSIEEPEDTFGMLSAMNKIFITYIQLLSIIRFIPLPNLVPGLFNGVLSAAHITVSSPVGSVSIQCSMPDNGINAQIGEIVVVIAIPVTAIVILMLFFLVWGKLKQWRTASRTAKGTPDASNHRTLTLPMTLLVTLVAGIFYYYESLVEHILVIFQCGIADKDSSSALATSAGLFTGAWWTRDYSLQCFTGQHGVLTWALGIPGILLFCLAVPLGTAWWLGKNVARLESDEYFMAAWGFVYKEYNHNYYAWESVIMLKKLLIVATLVLLANTGFNQGVQVLAAVAIITVSLVAHTLCKPYKAQKLHDLETMSQYAILATLYLSLYFTYGDAPHGFIAIAAFLMAINLGVMVTFLFHIGLEVIDTMLRSVGLDKEGRVALTQPEVAERLDPLIPIKFLIRPASRLLIRAHSTRVVMHHTYHSVNKTMARQMSVLKETMLQRKNSRYQASTDGPGSNRFKSFGRVLGEARGSDAGIPRGSDNGFRQDSGNGTPRQDQLRAENEALRKEIEALKAAATGSLRSCSNISSHPAPK